MDCAPVPILLFIYMIPLEVTPLGRPFFIEFNIHLPFLLALYIIARSYLSHITYITVTSSWLSGSIDASNDMVNHLSVPTSLTVLVSKGLFIKSGCYFLGTPQR